MAKVVRRHLLTAGNDKLGKTIHGWSIPAITTCPGRTSACTSVCYATHGRYVTDKMRDLMEWRLQQCKKPGFVAKMVDELFRRGVLVCRIHIAGDHFSPAYTAKWVEIVSQSPNVRFFCYTRSWAVPKIEPYLRALAALENMRLWYSTDIDTGMPPSVPDRVRIAHMQTSATEAVAGDLVFQIRGLRRLELPLAVPVCPQELPEGKERGVTCANCAICWR